jgi:hypothetical protein
MAQYFSPKISTSGLSLIIDAGNPKSYPGSGTTWTDLSGNSRTCTTVGSPAYSVANGGYFTFDTGTKYVTLPANIFNSTAFTAEMWVYQITQPTVGILFSSQGSNTANQWALGSNSGGYFFTTNDGSTRPGLGSGVTTTGVWTHIVATRNSSNLASLYQNGVLMSSGTVTTSFASATPRLAVNPINSGERLDGRIANFNYYTRALSADEVLQNFNATRGRFGV